MGEPKIARTLSTKTLAAYVRSEWFLAISVAAGLYAAFLTMQTGRHGEYFTLIEETAAGPRWPNIATLDQYLPRLGAVDRFCSRLMCC